MQLFNKIPNPDATVIKLLRNLSVHIDEESVKGELDKHPDYPSLLAVSDVLTAFDIENSAFRLSFEELQNLPRPFIAYVNSHGGDLMVINEMTNDRFYVSNEKWDNHKFSAEAFKKLYNGVVLTAEPSGVFTSPKIVSTFLNVIKYPALITGSLLILALTVAFHTGYLANLSWQLLSLTLFKSMGLITSVLLLVQSIDSNNPLVQILCQSQGKSDCNAILSSKAAKVPIAIGIEGLTWSEVGFFYFAGTWLLLMFGGNSPAIWQALALLNFVSLPYTVYSIYYQARIAKQWCVLCCTVQALLWLEFIPIVAKNSFSATGSWNAATISAIVICMLAPVILWGILKPLFLKLQQLQPLKQQLRKFKYNAELFNKMLTEQPRYTIPDESWSIVLGKLEANNIITMVTNPYCPPCAKTHKLLDEFLKERGNVQARIVFTANNTNNDIKTPVSRHLMALNELKDKTIVRKALHDWYEQKQKNYDAWAKAYPIKLNGTEYHKIDTQKAWCKMAEVTATPTMLLNGYRLPDLYQLTDLKYMLE
jgi:uncharacterized membrane protein/thiol-disulfide isomerase/thioredoxin